VSHIRYEDSLYAATTAFVGTTTNGVYRLDVSGTAATLATLPAAQYVVRLTAGVDGVILRTGGTAADPSSGSSVTGCLCASGDTYLHRATGSLSAIAIAGGSGRLYLVRVP